MNKVTLDTKLEDRDPDICVVLGSGPNNSGWDTIANMLKAHVICCNGSILSCSNPSAHIALDRVAVRAFGDLAPKYIRSFIGKRSIEDIEPSYKINNKIVRTVAVWGIYLAINVFKAKQVHVFGVYGSEGGKWESVSFVEGSFGKRVAYEGSLYKADKRYNTEPKRVLLGYQNNSEGSNKNTAEHIKYLMDQNKDVNITLYGGGPVYDILSKRIEEDKHEDEIEEREGIKPTNITVNKDNTDKSGGLLLVGSGLSLRDQVDYISNSSVPRFCINNSIQLIKNPDIWYAGDLWKGEVFPSWIWDHPCEKHVPNPNCGYVKKYTLRRRKTFKSYINRLSEDVHLEDIIQEYHKDTFLQPGPIQIGYPWRDNKFVLEEDPTIRSATSSFLAALIIAIRKGVKDIYLVGVDLEEGEEGFYAYGESNVPRDREIMRLKMVRGILQEQAENIKKLGVNIWNCSPDGKADMFPYVDIKKI